MAFKKDYKQHVQYSVSLLGKDLQIILGLDYIILREI